MKRILLLCAYLVAASPALAADTWTYARSDHFEVYTTGGEGRAREALNYFEQVRAFMTVFLKVSPSTSAPTRLIIFSNERQFAPYRPNEVAFAYYQPGPDRDYIVMQSLDADAYPVVVHEYTHLIVKHSGVLFPLWLNEGVSEFLSTLERNGNEMHIGRVPLGQLLYLQEGVRLMSLERLFSVGHGSVEYNTKAHAGVFYAQSWALTHLLLTDARYAPGAQKFLAMMEKGAASATAMEQAFGKSLAIVERDLTGYIRQNRFSYGRQPFKSPPTVRFPARTVDAFDADLVTANLLANSREREADARAAFERLATQKPDDLPLIESRAYFELRHGESANARPHLARAVELGSQNPQVYRDYAAIEDGKAEELLAKAVALAPQDLDTRLRYSSILLAAGRNGQALSMLVQAERVPAESGFQFFQLLAIAYMRLNEIERAKEAAAKAAQYAEPGEEARYAEQMIKMIDQFVANRDAIEAARRAAKERRDAAGTLAPSEPVPDVSTIAAAPFTPGTANREQPFSIVVTGRIRNMECGKEAPVLEVATPNGTVRLLVDNGGAITVLGTKDGMADLHCGSQDVRIKVGYIPVVNPARKTVGNVRLLDYRP
jgi:Flp pilus assembly protein TadD